MAEPSLHTITLTDGERDLSARAIASLTALAGVTAPDQLIQVSTVIVNHFRDHQPQLMEIWERLAPETTG